MHSPRTCLLAITFLFGCLRRIVSPDPSSKTADPLLSGMLSTGVPSFLFLSGTTLGTTPPHRTRNASFRPQYPSNFYILPLLFSLSDCSLPLDASRPRKTLHHVYSSVVFAVQLWNHQQQLRRERPLPTSRTAKQYVMRYAKSFMTSTSDMHSNQQLSSSILSTQFTYSMLPHERL